MGFAVVADEVRNMAQRSAQAAKEIAGKIEGSIFKTEQGVQISAKVALGLQEIVGKVKQVDDLVAEVAAASQGQSQGVEQLNMAITQMDKVTQSTAANAEESASAAVELNSQAEHVKDAVSRLQALVGNSASPSKSSQATMIEMAPHSKSRGKKPLGQSTVQTEQKTPTSFAAKPQSLSGGPPKPAKPTAPASNHDFKDF